MPVSNPIETLKDIGSSTAQQMRSEAGQIGKDFMGQLLGISSNENISGDLVPGETIEFSRTTESRDVVNFERQQLQFERHLIEEERVRVEKKTNELKIQLQILQQEILTLAQTTEDLGEETQTAAMQASVEPGVYHVIFFEKLLAFITSFRKKVEEASVWLHATNKRAAKKNKWGANYAKHGAKYLLSGEHYVSRSAG